MTSGGVDHAWAGLAEVLGEAGRQVEALAVALAEDWPDRSGQEWADRTHRVGGALGREANVAGELAAALLRPLPREDRSRGMRLPGTEVARVGDDRGMRLPGVDG